MPGRRMNTRAIKEVLRLNLHFSQSGVRSKFFGVGSGFWLN